MAKLSEQKKVELLEAAVLTGNTEQIRALFSEHGSFEFTARALGIACRFFGAETVKCLIECGATFSYPLSTAMVRKYHCTYAINSRSECNLAYNYECCLVGESIGLDKELKALQPLSAADRAEIIRLLCEHRENIGINLPEMLYQGIMNCEWEAVSALKECGVSVLSNRRIAQLACQRGADANEQYEGRRFSRRLADMNEANLLRTLRELASVMNGSKLYLSADDVMDIRWSEPDRLKTVWCTPGIFEAALETTNLIDRAKKKKWEVLYALVEKSNAVGLAWTINEGWASKAADFKKLFDHAQKFDVSTEMTALLLKYHKPEPENAKKGSKKKDDDLSLDVTISAAELKKLWSSKKQEDGTLIITSYKGTETDVVVPAMIGKAAVTAIDKETFSPFALRLSDEQIAARRAIRSVEFPEGIRELPENLFESSWRGAHTALEQVILPEGLESIGKNCFYGCKNLQEITLPQSLKTIGVWAFHSCSALTSVTVPDSIEEIGSGAFSGCTSLKSISLPQHITTLPDLSECGFEEFVVPQHITKLKPSCFSHCTSLRRVVLSDGIEEIPDHCFFESALETVSLPASVTKIDKYAFADCSALRPFDIPETVTEIGDSAFAGCSKLADAQGLVVIRGIIYGYTGEDKGSICLNESVRGIPDSMPEDLPPIVYRPYAAIQTPLLDPAALSVGDTAEFGRFPQDLTFELKPIVWRVIAEEDGKKLLLAENGLLSLHESKFMRETVGWADSSLRRLLKDDFLPIAFDTQEQALIQTVTLENKGISTRRITIDDAADTQDKVFLLSMDEFGKYLPNANAPKKLERSEYAAAQYSYYGKRGVSVCWLLRTCGGTGSQHQLGINPVWNEAMFFEAYTHTAVIRPAIWVK